MHELALSSSGGASGAGEACLFGLSLCSGAGGLDLGLLLACPGYRAVGHVERDAFAAAVLVARMEDAALDCAPVWDDVATFDGRPWRGAVDILTAGYPCQPFSVAGRRRGAEDPRHLWPHVARIVCEVEGFNRASPVTGPTYVDATIAGKRLRRGARLWTVAVSTFKAETYRFLRQDRPTREEVEGGQPSRRAPSICRTGLTGSG